MSSRRTERKAEGMVEDERRMEILWERIGWSEMWTFGGVVVILEFSILF